MKAAVVVLALIGACTADVYLHNPRGSNCRLDEANRDRANGNRMFDSQNNNRGGVNVGNLYYYAETELDIQYTSQHSCNNPTSEGCEIIIQYMCDDKLRDGTTTNTIPVKPIDCYNWDCDNDVRFGRHESWASYMDCTHRERNQGLFTSTQNLKGDTADKTRQNPNGARRGYECPEERDYYPYWGKSPWIDALILTNQVGRCAAYQAESQNVKDRYYCDLPYTAKKANKNKPIPITQSACEAVSYPNTNGTMIFGRWALSPSHGVAAPSCSESFWSRDNHLGNVEGGQTANLKWTIPSTLIHDQCTLRIRYNLTSSPTPHFDTNAQGEGSEITAAGLVAANNGNKTGGKKGLRGPANLDIGSQFKLTKGQWKTRGYELQNNPQVDAFGSIVPDSKLKLQLAVNTAQFGRTFQDRTHQFGIRARPAALETAVVHNMAVRGKRGNIVQTFPSTEYDFTQANMGCKNGEYVHFQWAGSNTNPNNNAGQGRQGTDRSNIVNLAPAKYQESGQSEFLGGVKREGQLGGSYPGHINKQPFLGLSAKDRIQLAVQQSSGELSELDDSGTYFNMEPKLCAQDGAFSFLGTRNNNFSNRSQKETMVVSAAATSIAAIGTTGGYVSVGGGTDAINVPYGAMKGPTQLRMAAFAADDGMNANGGTIASNIVVVHTGAQEPGADLLSMDSSTVTSATFEVSITYEESALSSPTLYYASSKDGPWTEVENAEFKDGRASATVTNTGFFMVETKLTVAYVVFIVLGVLLVLGLCAFFAWKKLKPEGASTASRLGI